MFEKAARLKLRFDSPKGQLSVEELWDLPLSSRTQNNPSLDSIAQSLHKQLQETSTVSFVTRSTSTNAKLELQFEIVKHIISVRLAENEKADAAREVAAKKERIKEIISKKKDQGLESASIEELEAQLATL